MSNHPPARKLNVLLIHDTHFNEESALSILGTHDLALASSKRPVLRHFGQVLDWLNTAEHADIDLLLVDCNFSEDKRAPQLPLDEHAEDPRGILYGAVVSAYVLGGHPRKPFGFNLYSQSLRQLAYNPYAQTFYGLLQVLSGKLLKTRDLKTEMENTPDRQAPSTALPDALHSYRQSLWRCFDQYLYPHAETFTEAHKALQSFLETGKAPKEDLAIAWQDSHNAREDILLSSLFADCRRNEAWDAGLIRTHEACEWLAEVMDLRNPEYSLLKPAKQCIERIENKQAPEWPQGNKQLNAELRALVFMLLWALDRCRQKHNALSSNPEKRKPKKSADLLQLMHLEERQISRALGQVLGDYNGKDTASPSYPGAKLLKRLDEDAIWSFSSPPWMRPLLEIYLDSRDEKFYGKAFRPNCLS